MRLYPDRIYLALVCCLIAAGTMAQQKKATHTVTKKTTIVKTVTKKVNNPYSNGIKIEAKGFNIKESYLVFEDERRVPAGNKVEINQQVNLRIILNTGFKEINGKVFPGGSEKLELSTGELILDTKDLFTAYDQTGVSPADAKYITLKSKITDIKDKSNFVIVNFRIWDKKSDDNLITGSYKIYIK
ncbi:MAG: hypothetical protein JST86_13965 [Bacteroidetes bacterium]|nr:hypothetical protein [Bacteroidota bacterium]